MLRKHSSFIKQMAICIDLLIIEISWFVWYKITTDPKFGIVASWHSGKYNSWKTGAILAIIWVVITAASRFYKSRRGHNILSEWRDVTKNLFSVTIVFIFFSSVFLDVHLLSRGAFAGFYASALVILIIERTSMRYALRAIRSKGFNYRNVLIIGAGNLGMRIAKKIQLDPWLGYKIVGYLDDFKHEQVLGKYPLLGRVDEFRTIVGKKNIDKIIIALPLCAYKKFGEILNWVGGTLLDCSIVPDIYQFQLLNSGIRDLDGIPLVDVISTPVEGTDAIIKRIADIIVSICAIIMAFPLLMLLAISIKLNSKGPILFRQKRHGVAGNVFTLYKFRSMRLHEESANGLEQAKKHDPRVTWVGKLLRRTSLDELPQLFNVIKGDMSIVGPRPHAVEHDDYYREKIAPYMQRFRIKPGITGWAQVNGWRGETPNIEDMEKRIQFDLEYIQNWDLWFDLRIIFTTLYRGFVSSRAY